MSSPHMRPTIQTFFHPTGSTASTSSTHKIGQIPIRTKKTLCYLIHQKQVATRQVPRRRHHPRTLDHVIMHQASGLRGLEFRDYASLGSRSRLTLPGNDSHTHAYFQSRHGRDASASTGAGMSPIGKGGAGGAGGHSRSESSSCSKPVLVVGIGFLA
ncbi:hypothetical protein BDN72DRAFT_438832 [Pluteus cervinus]|uniref:Uncharacterized protein n=1 Tax=Pluteus cervinus TaxID=181527 RepID=A0ACD3A754_9AGAR|nr:hypothetical protein BDN72DRAFT_438832 [Pluteus cervinus]